VVLALFAGCGSDNGSSGSEEATVDLSEQNGSGESGTATLTAEGDNKTKVVISLDGAPAGTPQPAHIHEGSCANLDPTPKYGLENVVDGKSTTEVDEPLDELRAEDYAINVHKSGTDLKTYVACGDIGSGGGTNTNTDTDTGYGY
jgi:hypothetical protein